MATKTNAVMDDMIRARRADMSKMPDVYSGPPSAETSPDTTDAATESTEKFTVAAPGDPGVDGKFEYEPFLDTPGAWVVYPPGVPCDDTEYRIQMTDPAGPDDFTEMQKALDDAGASSSDTAGAASPDIGASGGGPPPSSGGY